MQLRSRTPGEAFAFAGFNPSTDSCLQRQELTTRIEWGLNSITAQVCVTNVSVSVAMSVAAHQDSSSSSQKTPREAGMRKLSLFLRNR